jgi:apolipoprotein N-acyltransferase
MRSTLRDYAPSAALALAWGFARPDAVGVVLVLVGAWCLPTAAPTVGRSLVIAVAQTAIASWWVVDVWGVFGAGSGVWPWLALVVAQAPLAAVVPWVACRRPEAAPFAAAAVEAAMAWLHPIPAGVVPALAGAPLLLAPAALGGRPLLAALLVAVGARAWRTSRQGPLVLVGWLAAGAAWLVTGDDVPADAPVIAVVQPQIGAFDGRRASTADARAARLLAAIDEVGPVDVVVTPEGAWPFDPGDPGGAARRRFAAAWSGRPPTVLGGERPRQNVLLVVEGGDVTDTYVKTALVPLAERAVLGFGYDRYDPGPADAPPLVVAGIRFGALICYEDALPAQVRRAGRGADVVLAATHDAWLGPGVGVQWHLAASRLAAVTTGRWVLRPTTSGPSAVIDARGRLVWSTVFVDADKGPAPPIVWVGRVPLRPTGAPGAAVADVVGLIGLFAALMLARRPSPRDSGAPEA